MSYYYHSHHTPVVAEQHKQGWTGYTGVLQEMVAEVPTRGKDRLERKLSLDAHLLIARFVRERNTRRQMMLIAQDLAVRQARTSQDTEATGMAEMVRRWPVPTKGLTMEKQWT